MERDKKDGTTEEGEEKDNVAEGRIAAAAEEKEESTSKAGEVEAEAEQIEG